MKHTLIALFAFTLAASAAEYTQTSCRLRVVEGTWVDMSGFTHHLNVSHSSNYVGVIPKVRIDLAKYTNNASSGWKLANYWDEMYCPNDMQLGWQAGDIYNDHQIGYIVRVWFNNGKSGYVPTASSNTMFSLSVQPDAIQQYWHETPVAPPPAGVSWADYRISIYGPWMIGASLVNYGYWLFPVQDLNVPNPPPGYFN